MRNNVTAERSGGPGSSGGAGGSHGRTFMPAQGPGIRSFVWGIAFLVIVAGLLPIGIGVYYGIAHDNVRFYVDAGGLDVDYKVGRIAFAAGDIANVEIVPEPVRMGRTSGAGLGDFQMGWYRLPEFGRVYRLTTASAPYVFVDTKVTVSAETSARAGMRYVFSPEEPLQFVESLEDARSGTAHTGTVPFSSAPGKGASTWPALIVGLLIVPLGIALPSLVARGRRDLRYEVGPDGITVHHLGRAVYAWAAIEDVSVREEPLRGLVRLLGTSLPGYHVGRYRARDIGVVQMNATRTTPPLVVVVTKGVRIVLTPEDIDGFMRAVAEYRHSE